MKFKFTWGHGVIIALACFIIFICTLIFTVEFSKNTFDLVTDNYYEEEINYQQEIDATNNASLLKEKPKIEIIPDSGIKIRLENLSLLEPIRKLWILIKKSLIGPRQTPYLYQPKFWLREITL